jgi:hypothetical protein
LCLMSLIGCSNTTPIVRTVIVHKTEYVLPPLALVSRCKVAEYQGKTNLDLYRYAQQQIAELRRCNVDWQTLHNWIKEKGNEQPDKQL